MPVSPIYPFSALVASDDLRLALVLSAISPAIGGVLVRGEKGTAKSTAVRALTAVLPHLDDDRPRPLVELPVGATEDRVLGSLHLEKALADGTAEYEPGLLVKADRGLLYVDEVNLLPDHLVDVLLDAAAMGRCTVERDGVSVSREARFVLIGTMNPEEGELRPQLLDRFGLTVEVAAPREPAVRVEVMRRRLAFDADPSAFLAAYAAQESELRERLAAATNALPAVTLDDDMLLKIAELCAACDVDGLRADLVTARAAVAHAAWCGRTAVTVDDVRVAARLSLPHRRRRQPFDAPGLDESLLDDVLGPEGPDDDPEPPPGPGEDGATDASDRSRETSDRSRELPDRSGETSDRSGETSDCSAQTRDSSAGEAYRARLVALSGVGEGDQGRRSPARTSSGRRVGARAGASGGPIHLVETLRAAVPHQVARGRGEGRLLLRSEDLRVAVREGTESNLVLFCVDASGSMAARKRMGQVKTAILSLLLDAYRRRDTVGLITFRGASAELALPPTRSVDIAARRLDDLRAGGRTPLAEGLLEAHAVLERERRRDPRRRPLLVLVTDGRATSGADAIGRSRQAAQLLRATASVVIDCESGAMRLGLGRELAVHLDAEHLPVAEVDAAALTTTVRARIA